MLVLPSLRCADGGGTAGRDGGQDSHGAGQGSYQVTSVRPVGARPGQETGRQINLKAPGQSHPESDLPLPGDPSSMRVPPSWDNAVVVYRSANKTVCSAEYRIVWCPECRRRVLVQDRLEGIVSEVVTEAGGEVIEVEVIEVEVIEVEVIAGRVPLIVEVPAAVGLSRLAQSSKGRSSRTLRAEFPLPRRRPAPWGPSWFVSTPGGARLQIARRYVENHEQAA
jgi:putative transposase